MDPLLILINSLLFLNGKTSIYKSQVRHVAYKIIDTYDYKTIIYCFTCDFRGSAKYYPEKQATYVANI